MKHASIKNCKAKEGGGGYNDEDGWFSFEGDEFSGNTADYGGGFYNNFGWIHVIKVDISKNTANEKGGGIYNRYGLICEKGGVDEDRNMVKDNINIDIYYYWNN